MTINVIEACDDPALFAPWFRKLATWRAWFAFLKALFALPMSDDELAIFRQCTGRTDAPNEPATEGWLVCGRRAGKSFVLALIAVFVAVFRDWAPYLIPGERGTVVIIASDRRQARTIHRYISALLRGVDLIRPLIERETNEQIDLTNSITIEIHTASFKTVRGYTIIAALLDELAFWPTEDAAEPDFAVLDAIRPAMATVPGAILLCASSPYARRGALWNTYQKQFGTAGRILVWKADTRTMNPTVPEHVIAEAYARDPINASAEYGAEFRSDLECFVTRETLEAAIQPGVRERAPINGIVYFGFTDPSGGSGSDSMTLAIAHHSKEGHAVLDALREQKPPFSPMACVAEFARVLKSYRVDVVEGDRYAGDWPKEAFSQLGIGYRTSERTRSEIYLGMLPLLNSGRVLLVDDERLVRQFTALERRTSRGGRDLIDHPATVGSHDDLSNSAAGALLLAGGGDIVEAWGEMYSNLAARTQAADNDRKPDAPLPWHREQVASKQAENSDDDLTATYMRAWNHATGFRPASENCASCGARLGATRTTDGVDSWHPTCRPLNGIIKATKHKGATNERQPDQTI